MRALTLKQPWGTAIAADVKPVENRTWKPYLRVPFLLALHAGKGWDREGEAFVRELWPACPPRADHASGKVIAIVQILGVVRADDRPTDPWSFGPWCWVIGRGLVVDGPHLTGHLGLWRLPPDVDEALHRRWDNHWAKFLPI